MPELDLTAPAENRTIRKLIRADARARAEAVVGRVLREMANGTPSARDLRRGRGRTPTAEVVGRINREREDQVSIETDARSDWSVSLDRHFRTAGLARGLAFGGDCYRLISAGLAAEPPSPATDQMEAEKRRKRLEVRARLRDRELLRSSTVRWIGKSLAFTLVGLALGAGLLAEAAQPVGPVIDRIGQIVGSRLVEPWPSVVGALWASLFVLSAVAFLGAVALFVIGSPLAHLWRIDRARSRLVNALNAWIDRYMGELAAGAAEGMETWLSQETERREEGRRHEERSYRTAYLAPAMREAEDRQIRDREIYKGRAMSEERTGALTLVRGMEWRSLAERLAPAKDAADLLSTFARVASLDPALAATITSARAKDVRDMFREWLRQTYAGQKELRSLEAAFAAALPNEERRKSRFDELINASDLALRFRPDIPTRLKRQAVVATAEAGVLRELASGRLSGSEQVTTGSADRLDIIRFSDDTWTAAEVVNLGPADPATEDLKRRLDQVRSQVHSPQALKVITEREILESMFADPPAP